MPFITVSRMYGSGGSEVAERIARALGWTLYDNEMVDAVAERTGMTRAEVAEREERVPSMVERIAASLSLGTPESLPAIPDTPMLPAEEQVVDITRRVIQEAVQKGPAVLVGRGAQCVLAERADAIHVFCYSPRAALVQRAITELHIDPRIADRTVSDTNRHREQYVRRHFHRDWRDVANYHLCLDTHWLGIDGAAELVVRVARERLEG